jgi:hypothetical protein
VRRFVRDSRIDGDADITELYVNIKNRSRTVDDALANGEPTNKVSKSQGVAIITGIRNTVE